jgi:hypothetical protein
VRGDGAIDVTDLNVTAAVGAGWTGCRCGSRGGAPRARVSAALRAAPGSTSALVTAAGFRPTAAATISRLARQGACAGPTKRGYAPAETPAGAAVEGDTGDDHRRRGSGERHARRRGARRE